MNRYFNRRLWGHKSLEMGVQCDFNEPDVDFMIRFNTRGDHAGLTTHLQLGRLFLEFNIIDDRHWNWDENRWCLQGE